MRISAFLCVVALTTAGSIPALADSSCPNPNALGTSRTLVIDTSHPRLGALQYRETLPLGPHEVVLTFDDGPLPPSSTKILDILKSECVKATYFLVGEMAQNFPDVVRRIRDEGHTIGTHSYDHPLTFHTMPLAKAEKEINGGIDAVSKALGNPAEVAPFFRIPGLLRSEAVENYLASRSLVTWSVDFDADDWFRHITANEIARRAISRIESKGRGMLLLHDIHPATVTALPIILKELKARGYHIVHVVPAQPGRPVTVTEAQQWQVAASSSARRTAAAAPRPIAPRTAAGSPRPASAKLTPAGTKTRRVTTGENFAPVGHELSLSGRPPS